MSYAMVQDCSFHQLPTELIWQIVDDADGAAYCNGRSPKMRTWVRMRLVCQYFAYLGLPRILSHRHLFLLRETGGPLDLRPVEHLSAKMGDGIVDGLTLFGRLSRGNVPISDELYRFGPNTRALVGRLKAFALIHQFPHRTQKKPLVNRWRAFDVNEEDPRYLQQVADILAAMDSLTALTLQNVLHWDSIMSRLRNGQVGRSTLVQLSLVECDLRQTSLVEFLYVHRQTLRKVMLWKCWIQDKTSVEKTLRVVRDGMDLDEFIYSSRRPALSRPPSWQGQLRGLIDMFGEGSSWSRPEQDGYFRWMRPQG